MKRRVPWYVDQSQIDDLSRILWANANFLFAQNAEMEAVAVISLLDDFLGQTCERSDGKRPELGE